LSPFSFHYSRRSHILDTSSDVSSSAAPSSSDACLLLLTR
jgi:hypothetical protein